MYSADRYSIDELHAYAKANNYPEEAKSLQYYLTLRRRGQSGLRRRFEGAKPPVKLRRVFR
jgi:hypothetical protein